MTETYGPCVRSYPLMPAEEAKLSEKELFDRKARQGHAFVTADEAFVVKIDEHGESCINGKLVEVKQDGQEVSTGC